MPWVLRGLRNGIVTTRYPNPDPYADAFPAAITVHTPDEHPEHARKVDPDLCPTGAIGRRDGRPIVDRGRCVLCGRCVRARPDLFGWAPGSHTATLTRPALVVPPLAESDDELERVRRELGERTRMLRRSVHVRHLDTGSDGAEEWEILALLNPVYDVHRLGIFFTASPRHADILLVTGTGAHGMAGPLARTLQAMPRPVVVIAVGVDAISGGMVAPSYATTSGGLGDLVEVDVWVPGSPPSPFSLLHALLLATGRLTPKDR